MIDPKDPGASLGAVPLFWGTFFIGAVIAMLVAIPFGLMSAIYLTQYAHPRTRAWMKPCLEILAGVPTVVYGYFAALTVAPAVRQLGTALGIADASSESALAAGLVMSWARALGEFGATIMFAGNVARHTQTLPLLVYAEFGSGALETSIAAAAILELLARRSDR